LAVIDLTLLNSSFTYQFR